MKAHELLSDRAKWTQRALARSSDGTPRLPEANSAICFCAEGALQHCYPSDDEYDKASDRASDSAFHLFNKCLISVNDELGYDAVMQVLREADV